MTTVQRSDLERAYLLHTRPYRDSSVLTELLTQEHGRIGAVARGIRSRRSHLYGILQPFLPLRVSYVLRRELATLSAAEQELPAARLHGDAVYAGYYMNELLIRLVQRQDPHPGLFDLYAQGLAELSAGHESMAGTLRRFEKSLLDELGYGLILDQDMHGQPIHPDAQYRYTLERGAEPVTHEATGLIVRGSTLLSLAAGKGAGPGMGEEARRLLQAALGLYLGDAPLRSRQVMEAVVRHRSAS